MATARGGTPASLNHDDPSARKGRRTDSVEARLWDEGFAFNFFQAVRLLEKLDPERKPVGRGFPPAKEVVRFRAHLSTSFPPSQIYEIERSSATLPVPSMIVTFMGLTGPSGVLPQHYTELLMRQAREVKGPERHALRDWLDLFNHRLISLFYRAWEKYRFFIPHERGEQDARNPDPFTLAVFCFLGLGEPSLRRRLRVSVREDTEEQRQEHVLASIDDLSLLHYAGFFAHRPRCAVALEILLQDYFELPLLVEQFCGQWLYLEPANQSRLGARDGNSELGVSLVAGNRVWDVQSKFRVRLGPLGYTPFTEFLPDRAPTSQRKAFFLLAHLVRLYVGAEFDFDIQLVLKAEEVPACQLGGGGEFTPRLGWNTWTSSKPLKRDAEDAVFVGETVRWLK